MNHQDPNSNQEGRQQRKRGRKKLPERERKVRRLIQNRVSAMKCRRKKKEQFGRLSDEATQLRQDKQFLQMQVDQLTMALSYSNQEKDHLHKVLAHHGIDGGSAFSTYEGKASDNGQLPNQNSSPKSQVSHHYGPQSPGMHSMGLACPSPYPTPFSEPSMQQRYTDIDPSGYVNSMFWYGNSSSMTLPQPWNLQIGMSCHMHQPHSSVSPRPSGFIKYSQPGANNTQPQP